MATSSAEEQFQQNLEISNKAKEAYWQRYKELVTNLSLEHLEEFAKVLKEDGVTFNKEALLKDCQENLLKDILRSMERGWNVCNIGVNIATLEMIKEKFKGREEPNWRPHGKTVEEQTLPIRMQRLEAERRYLKKQIDFQNSKLAELKEHNAICRNEVEQIKVQRGFIREQMHRGTAELQNLKEEYRDMIKQVMNTHDPKLE